jgi:hypothetical protein
VAAELRLVAKGVAQSESAQIMEDSAALKSSDARLFPLHRGAGWAASEAAGVGKDQIERSCDCPSSFGLRSISTHDPTTKEVHVARALDWKRSVNVQSVREEDCGCGASPPHPHGDI